MNTKLHRILEDHKLWLQTKGAKGACADFGNWNLEGADLSRLDLSHADFSYANLKNANLEGTKLFKARFFKTKLAGARFAGADIGCAEFRQVDLSKTSVGGARFAFDATFTKAKLRSEDELFLASRYKDENGVLSFKRPGL